MVASLAGLLKPMAKELTVRGTRFRPSPLFTLKNINTIAVDGVASHSLTEAVGSFTCENVNLARRYTPFNHASIQNNSSDPVEFWINGNPNNKVIVLNRGIQDLSNVELSSWTVKNIGTAVNGIGTIVITVWSV